MILKLLILKKFLIIGNLGYNIKNPLYKIISQLIFQNNKNPMKSEIFQQTKQSILKNKQQFIEIQLGDVSKRISNLKTQNQILKDSIKELKSKSRGSQVKKIAVVVKNVHTKENSIDLDLPSNNKQNFYQNSSSYLSLNATINSFNPFQDIKMEENKETFDELKQRFDKQEREKQQQLQYYEGYLRSLKKIWQDQQTVNERFKLLSKENASDEAIQFKQKHKIIKKQIIDKNKINESFQGSKPQYFAFSGKQNSSLIESEQNQNLINNLNSSFNFFNKGSSHIYKQTHWLPEPRRKTLSLSENNPQSKALGFNFGKKSINKKPSQSFRESIQQKIPHQSSSSHYYNSNNQSRHQLNQNNNQSILSHSNSRSSISYMSNCSKSQMKNSEAGKSYAKIITKLECRGCKVEYKPNQYYAHLNECRQLQKLKLLEQKIQIQNQINQTLNLQDSHFND